MSSPKIAPNSPRCNGLWRRSRRPGALANLPRIDPGPWGGEGYCSEDAGWKTDHPGSGRCKYHGGQSLTGAAVPAAKHLGYSEYVPAKYLKDFEEGLNDPVIQREQSKELAGLHALIVEAWKRTGDGIESGETWKQVAECGYEIDKLYKRADRADKKGDAIDGSMARAEILGIVEGRLLPLIQHGAGEQYAKNELTELWQKRAKLIRVQQQGERTVPIEVLGVLLARTAAIASDVILSGAIEDQKIARRVLSSFVTRLRMETLPADGAGIVKRLDAQAGRGEIEARVKVVSPLADGAIDIGEGEGQGRDQDADSDRDTDTGNSEVTKARRADFRKGIEAGAILASVGMGIGTVGASASIADLMESGNDE